MLSLPSLGEMKPNFFVVSNHSTSPRYRSPEAAERIRRDEAVELERARERRVVVPNKDAHRSTTKHVSSDGETGKLARGHRPRRTEEGIFSRALKREGNAGCRATAEGARVGVVAAVGLLVLLRGVGRKLLRGAGRGRVGARVERLLLVRVARLGGARGTRGFGQRTTVSRACERRAHLFVRATSRKEKGLFPPGSARVLRGSTLFKPSLCARGEFPFIRAASPNERDVRGRRAGAPNCCCAYCAGLRREDAPHGPVFGSRWVGGGGE